jgi:FixJ family two-component response regulator
MAPKPPLICIIDDDESVRVGLSQLIKSIGFGARAFASAEDFLESSERHETSCLISDVQLPGINGLELQSRLASQRPVTQIIMMTAYPDVGIRERALAAGAICFLCKPFDGQVLERCLEKALSQWLMITKAP